MWFLIWVFPQEIMFHFELLHETNTLHASYAILHRFVAQETNHAELQNKIGSRLRQRQQRFVKFCFSPKEKGTISLGSLRRNFHPAEDILVRFVGFFNRWGKTAAYSSSSTKMQTAELECFIIGCSQPAIIDCGQEGAELLVEAIEDREWDTACPRVYCSAHRGWCENFELGRRRTLRRVREKIDSLENGGFVS
jgi:hypothetical protein